jgi:anti-anti-sigma regulatory factor
MPHGVGAALQSGAGCARPATQPPDPSIREELGRMKTQLAHRHIPHDGRPDDEPTAFATGLIMSRSGLSARLRITGQVSDITHRHLDDWLDWLIMTGAREVTVALDSTDQIDTRLLRVLLMARARLQDLAADLVVTAAGAPMRTDAPVFRRAN